MTVTGLRTPAPGGSAAPAAPALRWPGLRMTWLFLASRRVPATLAALALLGLAMWAALYWHWTLGSQGSAAQAVPVLIEAGAAAVIAVSTYSPIGEPERATGRWLPYLRLGAAVALTAAAIGALAIGSTGGVLPGGFAAMARNVAGITGAGLLCAAVLGGMLAWTGPMAYLVLTESALADRLSTPWAWPARPPLDRGGAICAYLVFAAGLALVTMRGVRESVRDTAT
jgi:hypothetical protein